MENKFSIQVVHQSRGLATAMVTQYPRGYEKISLFSRQAVILIVFAGTMIYLVRSTE